MRKLISVKKSQKEKYKLVATFEMENGRIKHVHFGSKPTKDYIIYSKSDKNLAEIKKNAYIARHSKNNEDWNNPITKGALSYHILWGPTSSIRENVKKFKEKFNL